MLFGKKLKILKKPNKEAEQKLREEIEKEGGLEKNDLPAMVISAFLVILLPIAVLLLIFGFIAWILFT